MKSRPFGPVFARSETEIRQALRGRRSWKNSSGAVQARFISLYLAGPGFRQPDDVTAAWLWYYRGLLWEGELNGQETPTAAE